MNLSDTAAGNRAHGETLTEDIRMILRSPQNRRPAGKDVRKKLWLKSIKKTGIIYIIILLALVYSFMKTPAEQKSGSGIIFLITLAVFTAVIALMFGIDKIRMHSETGWGVREEGLTVEKAYVSKVFNYRGQNLTIHYYDFMQEIFCMEKIKLDSLDFPSRNFCEGDFLDIVVKVKKEKVQYAAVLGRGEQLKEVDLLK